MSATTLRRGIATLNARASRDLAALWRRMESAAQAGEELHDLLPAIVDTYGVAASVAAAEWYDDTRAKRGVRGRFLADPAEIADTGTHALVGWALSSATNDSAFKVLIEGGVQRRIANFSRLTVVRSSLADPVARGWQRTGSGDCDFCAMLLGRGAVYTEATADFEAHDNCNCQAEPAF